MFFAHTIQMTGINTIFLGNAHIAKRLYPKQQESQLKHNG